MPKSNLTKEDVTPAVKSSVNAYLLARTYAETKRGQIDAIQRAILAEFPIYAKLDNGELITDPKHVYLCTDEAELKFYYDECNVRTRAAGLKPDDMPDSHCPALVAETIQTQTEHLLIECGAEMLGVDDPKGFGNKLLCSGLKHYEEFIRLIVSLVVNLPDYKAPRLTAA